MADLWQEIASTVASEFSDVPDAAQATRIVVRLTMAALLGGAIGYAFDGTARPLALALLASGLAGCTTTTVTTSSGEVVAKGSERVVAAATTAASISPPNSQMRCTWRSSTRW